MNLTSYLPEIILWSSVFINLLFCYENYKSWKKYTFLVKLFNEERLDFYRHRALFWKEQEERLSCTDAFMSEIIQKYKALIKKYDEKDEEEYMGENF